MKEFFKKYWHILIIFSLAMVCFLVVYIYEKDNKVSEIDMNKFDMYETHQIYDSKTKEYHDRISFVKAKENDCKYVILNDEYLIKKHGTNILPLDDHYKCDIKGIE